MGLILDPTAGITFPNSTTQASAGNVIQVVNASYSTSVTTTSGTPTATGLSASITPKFATSKILVIATMGDASSESSITGMYVYLYKNGSQITKFGSQQMYITASITYNIGASQTVQYLDSPATTSSTTYAIYFASHNPGNQITLFRDTTLGSMTLMEIAA